MRADRRLEILIFAATFFAFAWFNQGGGWNQNSRFAEVRAIAEQGTFSLDSFLIYQRTKTAELKRLPIVNGEVRSRGNIRRLSWLGGDGDLVPVNGAGKDMGVENIPLDQLVSSGDVAFARGHFHPNKPPGSSFAAVPGYFLLQKFERLCGRSPDDWRLLVANAWLASALSVGLVAAFGCVLFFNIAKIFAGGSARSALAATLTFAFGTLFFPFATLLFDHDLTAVFLLAAFYGIFVAAETTHPLRIVCWSGCAAGMAAITNYVAAVPVAMLGLYLLVKMRPSSGGWRTAGAYALGLLGPLLAICAYNQNCYGSPLAICNSFQNPLFKDSGPTFLGMFGVPRPDYAFALLVSPFRGLFYSAPVLLLGVYGLFTMRKIHRAECWLFTAIVLLFFLVNASFFGWHAGFSCGPRYLIPALPFLGLPLVFAYARRPRLTAILAIVSICIQFIFTAVDAESPAGVGSLAMVGDRPMWRYSVLADYAWPLFVTGRARPLLDALLAEHLEKRAAELETSDPDERARDLAQTRAAALASIEHRDATPFYLATFAGPVSANPIGVYEGDYFRLFGPHSKPTRWASFNAGELLFPQSRWSLAPLLALEAVLLAFAFRLARRAP